jgi:hypothetical protein
MPAMPVATAPREISHHGRPKRNALPFIARKHERATLCGV